MIGKKWKFPLTLCLISYDKCLLGISATIYNINKNIEMGLFLSMDHMLWKKDSNNKN